MLDHIFLTVRNLARSIAFYEAVLPVLGITARHDHDGNDGPPGHPDLKDFGANGRIFFWLRQGTPAPGAVHAGFVANSEDEVQAPTPPPLPQQARRKSIHPARSTTTIHATTPLRCGAPMGTASNSYSRVGNIEGRAWRCIWRR